MIMPWVIGMVIAIGCVAPFARFWRGFAADYGLLTLGIMVSVYVGAWLVTGTSGQMAFEIALAIGIVLAGLAFRFTWPVGIGLMIFAHSIYDMLRGAESGVAAWYPYFCAGFDVVAGAALAYIISRKIRQSS